jgi:hypothetical protein
MFFLRRSDAAPKKYHKGMDNIYEFNRQRRAGSVRESNDQSMETSSGLK